MRNNKVVLYITYDGILEPVAQSQVLGYIKGLSKKGYVFYIVSFEKRSFIADTSAVKAMEDDLRRCGITWFRLPYHSRPKILSTFIDAIVGILFCSRLIAKYKVGIVHARAEVPAMIALIIKKLFRAKFIYDRRGILAYDYVDGGMWKKDSKRTKFIFNIVNYLDRKFLLTADHIVVLTKRIADIIRNDFLILRKDIPVSIIPCCVDLERFQPAGKRALEEELPLLKNKFILVYAGSLGTWYMLEEMFDLFLELKRQNDNTHFLIITLSDHLLVKRAMEKKRVRPDDVTLIGRRYDDMPSAAAAADAAILFIKPVYSKIASCPTKFAEFLASGVPIVINASIGDTAEILRENRVGIVVEGFGESEYRSAIAGLFALREDGDGLRARCRETAQKYFALEDGVAKYLEIYKALQ